MRRATDWRLLVDPPATAACNMAIDEILYLSARRDRLPTVRLYQFDRPTISMGYRQRLRDAVDPDACDAHGVGLVRRLTGGRALLHQHELTWSVTAPTRHPLFRNLPVRGVYRTINGAIRDACAGLGVRLDPESDERFQHAESSVPCLSASSAHEITASGKKLVPSAQRRHRDSFLQHGSLLIDVDEALWNRVKPKAAPEGLEAVGLAHLLPAEPPVESLVAAFREAFGALFGCEGRSGELDDWERSRLPALEEKYRSTGLA